jgi:hypothetical protein
MTMLNKVQISSLVKVMSIRQQKELDVIEENTFSSHMEASISHNGNKSVMNYIMGFSAFVAMSIR